VRFKSATIPPFAKLRFAVLIHFHDISTYDTHSQFPCANKSRYLTFSRLQNLIQWQCDTIKLDTPMQILYNACKNTSCKILHATHAKQGPTKTEQSRRNCEIKQQFFMDSYFYFVTGKTKINFIVAPQQIIKKIKVRGLHITYENCQALQYSRH